MKYLFLVISYLSISLTCYSQEIVENGGFENLSNPDDPDANIHGLNRIWELQNWKTPCPYHYPEVTAPVGLCGLLPDQGYALHSPDWMGGGVNGSSCARMGVYELIQEETSYNLASFNSQQMIIEFDVRFYKESGAPDDPSMSLHVYAARERMKYKSANSADVDDPSYQCYQNFITFKNPPGQDVVTIATIPLNPHDYPSIYNSSTGQWSFYHITYLINPGISGCQSTGGCHDWLGLELRFDDYNPSSGSGPCDYSCATAYNIMFIDNVSIQPDCCPTRVVYQNYQKLPILTTADDLILAGNHVDPYHTYGDVVVKSGDNVTFQATNILTITPGFAVKPGGIYNMVLKPCSEGDSEDPNNIHFDISNGFSPSCDGHIWFPFYASGASYYIGSIYNSWGNLIYYQADYITNSTVDFWNGFGNVGSHNGVFVNAPCTVVYVITLYTCQGSQSFNGDLTVDGCESSKMMDTSSHPSFLSHQNKLDLFKVYPSLFQNSVVLNFERREDGLVQVSLFDLTGKMIKILYNQNYDGGLFNQTYNFAFLPQGVYFVTMKTKDGVETRKIVKM